MSISVRHSQIVFEIFPMAATSSRKLKDIRVLYGLNYIKYKEFVMAAIDPSQAIIERKLHLIYRKGDQELSKLVP